MGRGHFITVEGGEGVGKSTFCRLLCERLKNSGVSVHLTREPGGSPMADRIRQLFVAPPKEDPITPLGELYLISAARTQHVTQGILPNLQKGTWVLCDRFADSTRVYQGELGGLDPAMLENVISTSTGGLTPDVTFVLDCPAEVALGRIKGADTTSGNRGGASRYDDAALGTHKKMREAFAKLVARNSTRMISLDGSRSSDEAVEAAVQHLNRTFSCRIT